MPLSLSHLSLSPLSLAPSSLGQHAYDRLMELRGFSDHPDHLTRLFLSPAHRQAADAVSRMMMADGCDTVDIDALGTVVGRYHGEGTDAPALLIGSHIDTVKDAGSYDGTLGVVAGIAVVEALKQAGRRLPFAIEILAFGDEENVRFPSNLSSSRALAGTFDPATLNGVDEDGISFRQALLDFGGKPEAIGAIARDASKVIGYLEVHIEQGPVLQHENLPVGIVTAINGASRRRVIVSGQAGHAGTVPMTLRQDALTAASEMVLAVERLGAKAPLTVATVGRLAVSPNAVNVIPGGVQFTLDMRGPDDSERIAMVQAIETELRAIAARRKVALDIAPFYDAPACPCSPSLQAALTEAVARHQIKPLHLPSGAGHDAMAMAALCPIGMLFVRCTDGISHNPAEFSSQDDINQAIRILLDAVEHLALKHGS